MNYPAKKIPLSLSVLTIAISMAHADMTHSAPAINDTSIYKDKVSQSGNNTSIDLTSTQNATLDWASFDVASNESVIFNQRNSNSIAMNKIGGGSASQIFGSIKANGHVFLVNNNGFTFGQSAVIDTQGFLATTFNAELNGNTLKLSTGNGAAINIEQLNVENNSGNDTQYVAFYSSDTNLTGTIEDNSIGEDTHISFNEKPSGGTVSLPGLPIGFSVDENAINDENKKITIDESGKILSKNGTIILNGSSLSSLFTGNVKLPDQISAKNIEIITTDKIIIDNNIVASENNIIKNLSITSSDDININDNILGVELNLNLSAKNVTVSERTSINDSTSHEFSHLGGSNGLNSVSIKANNDIILSDSLIAKERIKLDGNIKLNVTDTEQGKVTFRADQEISLGHISIDPPKIDEDGQPEPARENFDLELVSRNIVLGNILDNENIQNVRIYSDDISLQNTYYYKEKFEINSLYDKNSIINLTGDLTFFGDEINLDNSIFNNTNTNESNLTFGDDSHLFSRISLDNIDMMANSNALTSINMFTKSNGKVFLSGNIDTQAFTLTTESNSPITIEANSDLNIKGLTSFDIGASSIKSNNHSIALTGDNTSSSSITVGNLDGESISIAQFNTLKANGSSIKTGAGDILIDTNQIDLTSNIDDAFSITTESGKITLGGSVSANNKNITLDSGTGGFSLSGIEGAKNVTIKNDASTNPNTEQVLKGNYEATDSIIAENLQSVTVTGNTEFKAGTKINLGGTQITTTEDITLNAKTLITNSISANNITIKNDNSYADSLELSGDLIAKNDLTLNVSSIKLMNALTLEGNINFLNAKQYTDPENKTGLVYTGTNITPTRINGEHRLTLNASNSDVYLYNMSDIAPLDSLTLNRIGDKTNTRTLHMIDRPSIAGSLGLSILGGWDWTLEGPLEYTAENQDLNLSGVNLNTAGSITFDLGTGNLSLGTIGSNGTTSDLIIKSASRLSLYGDITLTAPAQGYQFAEVNAIEIHKDLTFGAIDNHVNVNLGSAKIDGTYDLTIYSDDLKIGEVGSNIALQNLTIVSAGDLVLNENITLVGDANISANNIKLDNTITSTGFDIKLNANNDISMSATSKLDAQVGNIALSTQTGNIGLGTLNAKGNAFIQAHTGYIFNVIDDYVSNKDTSVNVTSNNLTLLGKANIGLTEAKPIVIDIKNNGVINTESDGKINIANLANAKVNTQSRVIDSSNNPSEDYTLFDMSSDNSQIEPSYKTTLGLIENASWQVDEEKTIKTIKTPNASPNLYYSRNGWRLGY